MGMDSSRFRCCVASTDTHQQNQEETDACYGRRPRKDNWPLASGASRLAIGSTAGSLRGSCRQRRRRTSSCCGTPTTGAGWRRGMATGSPSAARLCARMSAAADRRCRCSRRCGRQMPSVPTGRAASARRPASRAGAVDEDPDRPHQHPAWDLARARAVAARRAARRPAGRPQSWKTPSCCCRCTRHVLAACARRSAPSKSESRHSSATCGPSPNPVVRRLRKIPGIGLLTATALVVGHIAPADGLASLPVGWGSPRASTPVGISGGSVGSANTGTATSAACSPMERAWCSSPPSASDPGRSRSVACITGR